MLMQEYSIWKKNTPFLYDLVIAHALEWPSLTLEWLPGCEEIPEEDAIRHRLLLGTHTNGSQNYVQIADVKVPTPAAQLPLKDESERPPGTGIRSLPNTTVQVVAKAPHKGEVNRARHCPHRPDLVATKTVTGDVCIYDMSSGAGKGPLAILKGHEDEGYGLSWNPHASSEGRLLSGANDSLVCLWDAAVTSSGSRAKEIQPLAVFKHHSMTVGDVSWHPKDPNYFASAGDDRRLCLVDVRQSAESAPAQCLEKAHDSEINCVSFHPTHPHLIATGSADHTVALFDSRHLKVPQPCFHCCLPTTFCPNGPAPLPSPALARTPCSVPHD